MKSVITILFILSSISCLASGQLCSKLYTKPAAVRGKLALQERQYQTLLSMNYSPEIARNIVEYDARLAKLIADNAGNEAYRGSPKDPYSRGIEIEPGQYNPRYQEGTWLKNHEKHMAKDFSKAMKYALGREGEYGLLDQNISALPKYYGIILDLEIPRFLWRNNTVDVALVPDDRIFLKAIYVFNVEKFKKLSREEQEEAYSDGEMMDYFDYFTPQEFTKQFGVDLKPQKIN